ncbi:MAG: FAD-dependent oxidoreductase [Pseudomonadota bacterium]
MSSQLPPSPSRQGASPAFARHEQTFPTLTDREIERLHRFGTLARYADGEPLFLTGRTGPGMFVVLSGQVAITQRDGLGHVTPVIEQGVGQFLAEMGQLSGRPALVDGHAEGEVEVLLIPPDHLRALLMAEAELGERIMRALILRRVNLIQSGAGGPVLIGPLQAPGMVRLQGFLSRNGFPHHLLDPQADAEAAEVLARYAPVPGDLPLVVCPEGSVLRNPDETTLARALGMLQRTARTTPYDVAVVGSGPAGLATAVYAASEGLSVGVLDTRAFGGQAGASARIENYLGFPTGISGQALAGRAFGQAQKFGAEIMIPAEVVAMECEPGGSFTLRLSDGENVRARCVVIASGARYRRPPIERLQAFEGHGVWYWASPVEARLCADEEVVLVGGGNSAGQAAVFLAGHARKVHVLVRGPGLAASMSRYLIDRIAASPRIELHTETEVTALSGTEEAGLQQVSWRHRRSGETQTRDIRHLFLFVGADPATNWLQSCDIALDKAGFVLTGARCQGMSQGAPGSFETSLPGVFAVGDVRAGSVKRVGGAIGEGAGVVPQLHERLRQLQEAQEESFAP